MLMAFLGSLLLAPELLLSTLLFFWCPCSCLLPYINCISVVSSVGTFAGAPVVAWAPAVAGVSKILDY
jgi:hypothetical protein